MKPVEERFDDYLKYHEAVKEALIPNYQSVGFTDESDDSSD